MYYCGKWNRLFAIIWNETIDCSITFCTKTTHVYARCLLIFLIRQSLYWRFVNSNLCSSRNSIRNGNSVCHIWCHLTTASHSSTYYIVLHYHVMNGLKLFRHISILLLWDDCNHKFDKIISFTALILPLTSDIAICRMNLLSSSFQPI